MYYAWVIVGTYKSLDYIGRAIWSSFRGASRGFPDSRGVLLLSESVKWCPSLFPESYSRTEVNRHAETREERERDDVVYRALSPTLSVYLA